MSNVKELERERDALLADNARLRGEMIKCKAHIGHPETVYYIIKDALAATPAQSLARIRNQVREDCINAIAVKAVLSEDPIDVQQNCVAAIRSMKEPE